MCSSISVPVKCRGLVFDGPKMVSLLEGDQQSVLTDSVVLWHIRLCATILIEMSNHICCALLLLDGWRSFTPEAGRFFSTIIAVCVWQCSYCSFLFESSISDTKIINRFLKIIIFLSLLSSCCIYFKEQTLCPNIVTLSVSIHKLANFTQIFCNNNNNNNNAINGNCGVALFFVRSLFTVCQS